MKRGIAFLFVTILIDMMGVGLVAPVLPHLILEFTRGNEAHAASIIGMFGTIFALMQFVCSPLLGVLSDRFGRRPVIMLSNLGLAFDYVLMAMAPTLGLLFVGRIIAGITSGSMATASAYVADITEPHDRARRFGLLGVAFGIGFISGPAIGGLLGGVNPRLPFWFAALLSFGNTIYGLVALPESLPPEERSPIVWRRANPLGALRLLRTYSQLPRLAVVSFVNTLAGVVLPTVYVLYVSYQYGWTTRGTGISLMSLGICCVLAQAVLVKPAIALLGERGTMFMGLLCGAMGMAIFGTARTGPLFLLGMPLIAAWGIAPAAGQSLMTRKVNASEQGQLQGALSSLSSIAALVGPIPFALTYARSIEKGGSSHITGEVWLLSTVMLLVAAVLLPRTSGLIM